MLGTYTICNYGVKPIGVEEDPTIKNHKIIGGSYFLSEDKKGECLNDGYIFDDTGDNISHLNLYFADLTSTYWIWKNAKDEYIYSRMYRRKLNINNLHIDENTFYGSEYQYIDPQFKNMKNFCDVRYKDFNFYNFLHELSLDNKINLSSEMIDKTFVGDRRVSILLGIANKSIYDQFMSVFFDIIFQVWDRYGDLCIEVVKDPTKDVSRTFYNNRYMSYLGERLTPILFKNSEYFFGKHFNIVQLPQVIHNVDLTSIKKNYETLIKPQIIK